MSKITRRDFLNGTQVAIGASILSPWTQAFGSVASQSSNKMLTDPAFALGKDYYPPALTGLRGSHNGSWETMHARVSGAQWPRAEKPELYDLVVVGAGLSGLTAAYRYRQENPAAKILIVDNHDDFGGHAKRNEFSIGDRQQIAYGGTESIDSPASYSEVSLRVMQEIGIDVQKFYQYFDQELYDKYSMGVAVVFDEQNFGKNQIATGYGVLSWSEFVKQTPLSDTAKADLVRAFDEERDYLPGLSREEKGVLLSKLSYYDYLEDYVKVDQQVLEMYRRWGISFWCVGIEEIPAIQVQSYDDGGGMPGLRYTMPRVGYRGNEPYIFHFPDGNASIARLLVRSLLPEAVPGNTMEDVVTARVDYSKLDVTTQKVNLRLNSTVVNVGHTNDKQHVDVTYVKNNQHYGVRAKHVVMACYNSAIPYLCPELPKTQVAGLNYNVKIPLVYTKVLVDNWQPFVDLGASFVYFTNDFYKQIELDYPVSMGDYQFGSSPSQPMTLHMCHVPYFKNISGPEQWRAGRRSLLSTPFSTYEHHVKNQLQQAVGDYGFDVDKNLRAITVNRWSHGYSYNPDLLWEPEYKNEEEKPWVIGRKRFGRIAIANSDAAAAANSDAAMTQGDRAVSELLAAYSK